MLMYHCHNIHISPCRQNSVHAGAADQLLVGTGHQAKTLFTSKPTVTYAASHSCPPVSFSPAAAVHHNKDLGLARHDQNPSRSSSLPPFFLILLLPITPLGSLPLTRWWVHPEAPGNLMARQLTPPCLLALQRWAGAAMNDLAASNKRQEEECNITDKPGSSG